MEIKIYNGEIFHRGRLWYILAGISFTILVLASLFSSQLLGASESRFPTCTDRFSAIFLLVLFGAYWGYVRKEIEKKTSVRIEEDGLWIAERYYQRHAVQGFSLEFNTSTQKFHTIIFLVNRGHKIYSLVSDDDEVEEFVKILGEYTPFVESFEQSWIQRWLRRLKI